MNRAPKRYKGPKGPLQHQPLRVPPQLERRVYQEGQAVQQGREYALARSISTSALRRLPSAQDVVEIQAYILRREGYNYGEIARFLEVGPDLARTLVSEGGKICIDEDPLTSLRLHLGRLETLLAEWFPLAFVAPEDEPVRTPSGALILTNPEGITPREEASRYLEKILKILALQQSLGTWLATLPRRGQERRDEDDHAEIKAILMRAEEYGTPPGPRGTAPHGIPSLADWRPADAEDGV